MRDRPPHPIAVIGAGAAGLLAALFAGRGGAPAVLIERTADGGRKILISGGGRCNILPSRSAPERFVTESSPHSVRKMLGTWPLHEQRAFLERELRMALVLEAGSGKLFPQSGRARDVRDRLVERVGEAGVRVLFNARVTALVPPPHGGGPWTVRMDGAAPLPAAAVVLATGGESVPATGSDGTGLRLARALGHAVHPTYPALTPLLADPPAHAALAGISLEVSICAAGRRPRYRGSGGFLFTHRGYSGPAVLDASHLAVRSLLRGDREPITVQWSGRDAAAWERALMESRGTVGSCVARDLPARLASRLLEEAGIPRDRRLAQLERSARRKLVELLAAYPLPWTGHEGYRKAEVTGGGVALAEVDPVTLESRRRPGLFLCGEILDAFGPIGGHNFQWAWATGRAAGMAAAARARPG